MARVIVIEPLAGQTAGWFDPDSATGYDDGDRWDGHNNVGAASGSQWTSETLYRTAGGRWVLNRDASRCDGGPDTYEYVTDEQARDWLMRTRTQANEDAIAEHFPGTPQEVQYGRPEVGPQVVVRMPETLRDRVDAAAAAHGVSRASWIRAAVESALSG